MKLRQDKATRPFLAVISLLGWFALIAQFFIIVTSKQADPLELIVRYFSYFTITTNLVVAICCLTIWLIPRSKLAALFSRSKTLTAINVDIIIVGIIYNIILRPLWHPHGLQLVVDELLHSVIPLLFLVFWLKFVKKNRLKWKNVLAWQLYPLGYLIFVMCRGVFSGFYPYPFLNVDKLGLTRTFINALCMAVLFLSLSLLMVWIGKAATKKTAGMRRVSSHSSL